MSKNPKCLAAYTEPGGNYPPFVNFSRLHDGRVQIIIRAADGNQAEIVVSATVFKDMMAEIKVRDGVTGVA